MTTFEVLDVAGRVRRIADDDPIRACERVADLHRVDVVAWRYPRVDVVVGARTFD